MSKRLIICYFVTSILSLMLVIPVLVIGFIGDIVPLSIIAGCLYLITGIKLFKFIYPKILIVNRKSERWCKVPSAEELEIVEDAKELIKRVDNKIVISDFSVYKVRFWRKGRFYYDKDTQELCIFIPFKFFLKSGGKDLCFLAVLHEVLHSQNLKNNLNIFNRKFLEGLNQLLTNWLIDNYSEKYKIPESKYSSIRLIGCLYLERTTNMVYPEEVNMVKDILQESNMDLKEVFLKYVDFQPDFFKSFVPLEYFKKQ